MKHNSRLRKWISCMLAISLACGMVTPAFAVDDGAGSTTELVEQIPADTGTDQQPTDEGTDTPSQNDEIEAPPEEQPETGQEPSEDDAEQAQPEEELPTMDALEEAPPVVLVEAAKDENGYTILDITKGTITISDTTVSGVSADGNAVSELNATGYHIVGNGTGTTNAIFIKGGKQNIILDNINITSGKCIQITNNSDVTLNIQGTNSVKNTERGIAMDRTAVRVDGGCKLTIEGTDTDQLTAKSDYSGAGIGGDYKNASGEIVINSGRIIAQGGLCAAGIGGASGFTAVEPITINGGIVTATGGGTAAGIGTGWTTNMSGMFADKITINDGIIMATGGGNGTAKDEKGVGAGIGAGMNAYVKSVVINGGTIKAQQGSVSATNGAAAQDIGQASWADGSGAATESDKIIATPVVINGGSVIAVNGKVNAVNSAGTAVRATIFAMAAENANKAVTVTAGGSTWHATADENGDVIAYLSADTQPARVVIDDTADVYNYTVVNNVVSESMVGELYIDKGPITIGDNTISGYDQNGNLIDTPNSNGYLITQSDPSVPVNQMIKITGGTNKVVLQNINLKFDAASGNRIDIDGNAIVDLTISGTNRVESVKRNGGKECSTLQVNGGSSLTINGTNADSLYVRAFNSGAAIGGKYNGACGNITINGGNIQAYGGSYSAGIGGASGNTAVGKITITGGKVYAQNGGRNAANTDYGINLHNCGAGIGTGGRWADSVPARMDCEIEITGGEIVAVGGGQGPGGDEKGSGAGIGGGQNVCIKKITITGGTVVATGGSTFVSGPQYDIGSGTGATKSGGKLTVPETPVYITNASVHTTQKTPINVLESEGGSAVSMVELPTWASNATATITMGAQTWTAITDDTGKLYPFMTVSDQTLTVTISGRSRTYHVKNQAVYGVAASPALQYKNQIAGDASGTLTITQNVSDGFADGYVLYWGDDAGKFSNYTALAKLTRNGASTSYQMPAGLKIPKGATKLYVYETHGGEEYLNIGTLEILEAKRMPDRKPILSFAVGTDVRITNTGEPGTNLYSKFLQNVLENVHTACAIYVVGDAVSVSSGYATKKSMENAVAGLPDINLAIGPNEWGLGVDTWKTQTGNSNVYYAKDYNGVRFIVLGSTVAGNSATLGAEQLSWLAQQMESADQSQPVFIFLNQPVSNTTAGTETAVITDENELLEILNRYPNTVVFSGATKQSMNNAQNVVNGEGQQPSYVNVASVYDTTDLSGVNDSQYVAVEVYENEVRIRGCDMISNKWISASDISVFGMGVDLNNKPTLTYEFTDKNTRGRAGGTLTVKKPSATCDSFSFYWADAQGKLAGYAELRNAKRSGDTGVYVIPETVMIPLGATQVLAYEVTGNVEAGVPCATFDLPTNKLTQQEKPVFTFVAASDYQMTNDGTGYYGYNVGDKLRKTFDDINTNAPDAAAIVCAGDVTQGGATVQYNLVKSIVESKGLANKMYYTTGNHDLYQSDGPANFKAFTGYNSLYNKFDIKGYTFITLSNSKTGGNNSTLGAEQINWLDEQLQSVPKSQPVFIINHQTVQNTVNGSLPGQWGYQSSNGITDEAALLAVMNKYPNIVYISGHTHVVVSGGNSLYDGKGLKPSYINDGAIADVEREECPTPDEHLNGAQGLYIDVYRDKLVIRGRDFANEKWIPTGTMLLDMSWLSKAIEGTVAINGTAKIGQTLQADISGITPADATYTYAWYREGDPNPIGTSNTYKLVAADIGKTVTLRVTGSGEYTDSLSATTKVVEKNDAPAAPLAPTLASKTDSTIVLDTIAGQEYRMGNYGVWQSSGEFTGLTASSSYSFFTRVAETETVKASEISAALEVVTDGLGVTVNGSASFGAGKVPQIAALAEADGLTIDAESAVNGAYTLLRTVDSTEGVHAVTFAIVKTGETKAAISVKLTGTNEDLSGVTATFKADSLNAKAFAFELGGVPSGTYRVETYKKNHTKGTMNGIVAADSAVSLAQTFEMLAGDLNGDNQIVLADYSQMLSSYNTQSMENDLDDNGSVQLTDYTAILASYNQRGKTYTFTMAKEK